MAEKRDRPLSEQRKQLPDQPGVYLFKDARRQGDLRRQGDVRSASGWPRTSPGPIAAGSAFIEQVASIDFLVTETEAEALLAEQQFIKRHRPRFNIRLRDDKSYPYIGRQPRRGVPARLLHARAPPLRPGLLRARTRSAKRVRETLDLLGKLFQYRTCEGPEPGRRSGVPCLDYYIKRCQAPCVGYIDREEYRRNIEAIVDFLSGRYRDVERDLERKMAEASGDEEFERAAIYRDRLEAVRSLMQRRSVAGRVAGDRRPGRRRGRRARRRTPRSSRCATACSPSATASTSPTRAERDEAEVTEEFLAQYYSAAPAVPRLVVVGPGAARARRAARRGAVAPPRRPGRGARRRARRQAAPARARRAQRQARPGPGQAAPGAAAPAAGRRARRAAGRARPGVAARADRGLRRLEPRGRSTPSPRWSSFEGGAPKKSDYRRFKVRGDRRGEDPAAPEARPRRRRARTTSRRWRRSSGGASRSCCEQADRSPHDPERDESFAALPDLIVIDGGKGQLSAGMRALAPAGRARERP